MKEIIMTPGTHIEYETSKKSITFGDEDLTINLKNREMDEIVTIDICSDKQGFLVIGAETGYKYGNSSERIHRNGSRSGRQLCSYAFRY